MSSTRSVKDLTFEDHVVDVDGWSMSQAMLSGLVGLHWVQVGDRALLRGRMGSRELFDAAMRDPRHMFHPQDGRSPVPVDRAQQAGGLQ
jgi:hypothetical protein